MKDFFKEINIIDILGIGVPGCLLVLLLGGDQTAELLWMDQFQNKPMAFAVMLIAAGSLAGMLLQELGDLIEKGLWMIPWLDPKVYAAIAVNTDSIDISDLQAHQYTAPANGTGKCIKIASSVAALAAVVGASVLVPVAMRRAAGGSNATELFDAVATCGVLPLPIGAIAVYFMLLRPTKKIVPETNQKKTAKKGNKVREVDADTTQEKAAKREKIEAFRNANPYIQTQLVGHGNTSKRTLFDGWRFVMRNLVLVLAVTNLVSLWKPLDLYRRVAGLMVGADGSMTTNLFWLTFFASCAIMLMLVRYYHYAYLRYKYTLEDYIHFLEEKSAVKK